MASAESIQQVQKAYIAFYQRPADVDGLNYWAEELDSNGGDMKAIIDTFANSQATQNLYGNITNDTIGSVVEDIYQAAFNRGADASGKDFYVNGFKSGDFTPGTIALDVLNGAQNEDPTTLQNKLDYAENFTQALEGDSDKGSPLAGGYAGDDAAQQARNMLANVTEDAATVKDEAQLEDAIFDQIVSLPDPSELPSHEDASQIPENTASDVNAASFEPQNADLELLGVASSLESDVPVADA